MANITTARKSGQLGPEVFNIYQDFPMEAAKIVYQGCMTALNAAGNLVDAGDAGALVIAGIADPKPEVPVFDNSSGAAGALVCRVAAGVRAIDSDGSIGQAQVGKPVYVTDNHTVGVADNTAGVARMIAGTLAYWDSVNSKAYVCIGLLVSSDSLLNDVRAIISGPLQIMAAAGAVSVAVRTTTITLVGAGAFTLADGTRIGQRKTINSRAASTGVVTPAHGNGFATVTFSATAQFVELEWDGGKWNIAASVGVAIA